MSFFDFRKEYKSALMQRAPEAAVPIQHEPPVSPAMTDVAIVEAPKKTSLLPKVTSDAKAAVVDKDDDLSVDALSAALEERQIAMQSLFGCEAEARSTISRQIADLRAKKFFAEQMVKFRGKYFPVSLEVLKWRDDKGLPIFALFSLADPRFSIASDYIFNNHTFVYPPSIPSMLTAQWQDVKTMLQTRKPTHPHSWDGRGSSVFIGTEFSGVIPEQTRTKIKEAIPHFEGIYLLAEPEFKFEIQWAPIPADPLVLGWDGAGLWLIDEFDITPLEEAAILTPLSI